MSYVLKVKDVDIRVPLTTPEDLWTLKEFNPDLPLIMMITGWTTNFNDPTNPTLDKIYNAYSCRGNYNFVVRFLKKTFFFSKFIIFKALKIQIHPNVFFNFIFHDMVIRLLIQVSLYLVLSTHCFLISWLIDINFRFDRSWNVVGQLCLFIWIGNLCNIT